MIVIDYCLRERGTNKETWEKIQVVSWEDEKKFIEILQKFSKCESKLGLVAYNILEK